MARVALPVALPHLDDGIVSEILHRLPTKIAYRLAVVCRQWRELLSQPTFLCRHLSPPALSLLDDRPYALILQPLRKVGFTHLTLVATDPTERVPVSLPLKPEYTARAYHRFAAEPPAASPLEMSAADPAAAPPLEDYVVFFEHTVQMLNISVVAAHGRLLLCRSPSRYYVCDPTANRWVVLPPSTVSPSRAANSGLHYDVVDASAGRFVFTVVLLVRRRRRRVLVEAFSSETGRWAMKELAAPGAARCLRAKSPGVHVGTCFYWLNRRWGGGQGRIIRYDAARCHVSVLREPPLAGEANSRVRRSLGSVGNGDRLRLCAFDIREKDGRNDDSEGTHGVWLMDRPVPAWRHVHEAVVEISINYFKLLLGEEVPVDFASACGEFVLLEKEGRLLRYDLESGSKVELADLAIGSHHYDAFPFFK